MRKSLPRLALSGAFSAIFLAVSARLPHINDTTAALLMVLCISGISIRWGWAEALTAAIIGAGAYDYYFLGPLGFSITAPEYGVALAAFVITAISTSQLNARLKRHQIEVVERHGETEKLYRLTNAMLTRGGSELSLTDLADQLAEIFGADGVALYDRATGQLVRSGPGFAGISDYALYQNQTATANLKLEHSGAAFLLTPIRRGGELAGSMAMSGAHVSDALLRAIAERVELAMARLDASERATEAEVIRRTEELKSAVLDTMAHEIRNPLNSIKMAATTLLSAGAIKEQDRREMLTIIDEEATRMDRLIDESVQMARVEAQDLSLKKEPQNLARLIPKAIDEMRITGRHRAIQVSVPESLPPAECDGSMIVRVVKQLVSNALKYSPENSPLTVSAEFTGEAVVIDVVDGGPGVNEDERGRIFEKGYRGRAARRSTSGTGLGLASARAIVRAHGGEIWLTSPPAGGAAFHVSLPARMAHHLLGGGGNPWALRRS